MINGTLDTNLKTGGQILPEAAKTVYPGTFPEVLGAAVEFSRTPYILIISIFLFYIGIRFIKKGLRGYKKNPE